MMTHDPGLGMAGIESDQTVQAFAQWLTELKGRSNKTLQEMLSEMSMIRDGITSNNVELGDYKRHSSGISQQMQSQLTDLREKLSSAFGEITELVKQKTQSDQEMMSDIQGLQQNLSCKTNELEALKKSYSQAHVQLQSSLIQIQNNLQVTNTEVQAAKGASEKVQHDNTQRFNELDDSLRNLEDELKGGNAEHRKQMSQLQEEIARIHESLASVNSEFLEHKRSTKLDVARIHESLASVNNEYIEHKRTTKTEPIATASSLQHIPMESTVGMGNPMGVPVVSGSTGTMGNYTVIRSAPKLAAPPAQRPTGPTNVAGATTVATSTATSPMRLRPGSGHLSPHSFSMAAIAGGGTSPRRSPSMPLTFMPAPLSPAPANLSPVMMTRSSSPIATSTQRNVAR